MPGGKSGMFPRIEQLHQSEEYKQRQAEDELLRSVGRERLVELAQDERDGRLVVLPCKETPCICGILGVKVDERFTYPGMTGEFLVTKGGHIRRKTAEKEDLMTCVTTLINHPHRIIRRDAEASEKEKEERQ